MTTHRVVFGGGEYNQSLAEHGFHTADAWLPARALTGLRVNLGTKDGLVYEKTTVTGVTEDGALAITGGIHGWPQDRKPVPTGSTTLPVTEIARGFTWAQPPAVFPSGAGVKTVLEIPDPAPDGVGPFPENTPPGGNET